MAHRSIPIAMKPPLPTDVLRGARPEKVERSRDAPDEPAAWADEAEDVLRDPRLKPPGWTGSMLAAMRSGGSCSGSPDHAGGDWPDRARAAAIELSGRGPSARRTPRLGGELLGHIRDVFTDERMTCAALVDGAERRSTRCPYGGWSDGKGITTRELGRKRLPRTRFRAKPIRIDGWRSGTATSGTLRGRLGALPTWNRPRNRYTGTTRMVKPKPGETTPVQTTCTGFRERRKPA